MSTIDTISTESRNSSESLAAAHRNLVWRLAATAAAAAKWFSVAMLKRRTRLELRELPDELLRDVGLTRAEAIREAGRPFWQ